MPVRTPPDSMSLLSDIAAGALDESYAKAAARPDGAGPPRRPLVALGIAAAAVLVTLAATSAHRDAPGVSRQRRALSDAVGTRSREVAGLGAALQRLRLQVTAAQDAVNSDGAAALGAQARLDVLRLAAGGVGVHGAGILVSIDDRSRPEHRVADADLQQLVNTLWAGGADAVAVGGVRLSARSAIRSAGAAVLVDFRPLAPPYQVSAVGDPNRLADRLAASPIAARLRTAASTYGGSFRVRSEQRLALPPAGSLP